VLTRMRRIRPLAFILGFVAAIVLTGGGVAAYAANGGSLLIGRSNTGSAVTTLMNTAGTPLSLRARSSAYAPFAVNSPKLVTNLNADKFDGLNWTKFALTTARTGNIFGTSEWAPLVEGGDPDPASGVIISVATCPAGTKLTGGGNYNGTYEGFTFGDFPDANSWVVYSTGTETADPNTTDVPDDVESYAVCYHPRGPVPGSQPNARAAAAPISLSPAMQARLTRAVARASK